MAIDGNHLSNLQFLPFYAIHKLFQSGNLVFEYVCGFESRNIVSRDNECGVLADVACGLLSSGLHDEGAEATGLYVFTVCEAVLDNGHELFDNSNNRCLVDAGCLCDFIRYFCFSHKCFRLGV